MAGSGRGTMTLAHELDRYLSVRRSLGYDLGTAERALRRFVQYADEQGVNHITTDLFLGWQGAFGNARRSTWGARFIMVRLFSQWLHGLNTTHQVLPRGLVPYRHFRTHHYFFPTAKIVPHTADAAQIRTASATGRECQSE